NRKGNRSFSVEENPQPPYLRQGWRHWRKPSASRRGVREPVSRPAGGGGSFCWAVRPARRSRRSWTMRRLTDYQGYIFDLDGTIYLGERLIDGARETVLGLRAAGKRVVFLSNKPLETRDDYARKLTRLGIPTPAEEVINSSWVMARWLAAEAPGATVYVIGEPPLLDELRRAGLHVVEDPSGRYHEVRFVIAAFDRTFHYQKLNHALQAIRRGARFVATNSDRTCPVED